eukprot:TRINITY_DN6383_c0_g1_i1.p1 TRINITY_DN6383_c0_g1~~TRINITY_DN6383_c0_g1_i1.p1  ORF type:complete len:316 (+),score=81.47 TRINITY_DN6383_c0_g1_i1:104-1051(+)
MAHEDQDVARLAASLEKKASLEMVFAGVKLASEDIHQDYDPLIHDYASKEEKDAFAELQEAGQGRESFEKCKPFWQLACLRARKYRIERTLKLIDNYMKWRKTFQVEEKTMENDETMDACLREGVVAAEGNIDRHGRYVVAVRIRKASPPGVFSIGDKLRAMHAVLEQLLIRYPVAQARGVVMIVDFSNLDKDKHQGDRDFTKQLFDALNNNLPVRTLGQYLISPPWFIRLFFPVVRLFMKKKLQERTKLMPKGYEELLECIDKSQLASDMGGDYTFDINELYTYIKQVQTCYPADKHPDPNHASNSSKAQVAFV